ncbi:MAG: hypothetical protein QM764_15995 [Chitinophagaceae bacterium]
MNDIKQQPKKTSGFKRFFRVFIIMFILVVGVYIYWKYFFVFGQGVKSGYLNFAVYKGQIFKTYEGKLIQQGIKSQAIGSVQSNEFEFSIKDKHIFDVLSVNSGKIFDLHYKEYNGIVPWRGNTLFVVDSIISMHDAEK